MNLLKFQSLKNDVAIITNINIITTGALNGCDGWMSRVFRFLWQILFDI